MREPDIFIYVAVGLIGTGGIALGVMLWNLARTHNTFVEHVALQHKESDKLNHMRFETAMLNYETALRERENVDESLAEMQATVEALEGKNFAYVDERLNNLATIAKGASEEVHRVRGEMQGMQAQLNKDLHHAYVREGGFIDELRGEINQLAGEMEEAINVKVGRAEAAAGVAIQALRDQITNLPAGPDAVDILNAARSLLYPYDPATGTPTAGPPIPGTPDGYPATQPWGTNAVPNPIDAPPSDDELAAYLPDDAIDPAAEVLAFFDRGMGIEGEVAGVVLEMEGEGE